MGVPSQESMSEKERSRSISSGVSSANTTSRSLGFIYVFHSGDSRGRTRNQSFEDSHDILFTISPDLVVTGWLRPQLKGNATLSHYACAYSLLRCHNLLVIQPVSSVAVSSLFH